MLEQVRTEAKCRGRLGPWGRIRLVSPGWRWPRALAGTVARCPDRGASAGQGPWHRRLAGGFPCRRCGQRGSPVRLKTLVNHGAESPSLIGGGSAAQAGYVVGGRWSRSWIVRKGGLAANGRPAGPGACALPVLLEGECGQHGQGFAGADLSTSRLLCMSSPVLSSQPWAIPADDDPMAVAAAAAPAPLGASGGK